MPKFSNQRILQSKKVFCEYIKICDIENISIKKIEDKAMDKTSLLLGDGSESEREIFDNAYNRNFNVELNNSIRMSIPKIKNRYQSSFAMFYADDSIIIDKEESSPRLFIFSRQEFINYAINKQLELMSVGQYRSPVIGFYHGIGMETISEITGLSMTDLSDEIEYIKSKKATKYMKDTTYMLEVLINCNKIVDFIGRMIDIKRDGLFRSTENNYLRIEFAIKKIVYEDKEYFCVPCDEDDEIKVSESLLMKSE